MGMNIGKFTCPYCYGEHKVDDCGLRCSFNIIGDPTKRCKFDVQKYDDNNGYGWIPRASMKKCMDCKEAAVQLFCTTVNEEIPIEFLSMKSMPIALVGAKASGKSNYIGVLVNEIRKKMTRPFNCSLSMTCSQKSKQAYNDLYYRPLFEEGHAVDATKVGNDAVPPLIFPLRFMDAKNKIVNMAALTFYDTAGENLDDTNAMLTFNKYITNAKGIILLLDPLQVPLIRNQLTAKGFTALPPQNTEASEVLDRIVTVIRNVKNIKGQIDIPLALAFTKIDVLEQVLDPGSCLLQESEHINRGMFVKTDFENTNIEMETLIENWLDADILGHINQFKYHSYFGLTALGANPTNMVKLEKAVNPRRVLDPLLWLLAENGYIKTLKK